MLGKNFKLLLISFLMLPVLIGLHSACSNGSLDSEGPTAGFSSPFAIEPSGSTTIGVGQTFNIYSVLNDKTVSEYPMYLSPSIVNFTSQDSSVATINSDGLVYGLNSGTTTIQVAYLSYEISLQVTVSGVYSDVPLSVPGQTGRRYDLYSPDLQGDLSPRPLLIASHGGGGSSSLQSAMSLLVPLAAKYKFYLAFTNGTGAVRTFNGGACCGYAQSNNINDVAYFDALIEDMKANFNINSAKVYSTGFSNGGIISHRLACELSDKITAIAAVGGASGQFDKLLNMYYACNPSRKVPILHIHALNDRNYPYYGGYGNGISATNYYPVESTINDWLSRNNLTSQPLIKKIGSITQCYEYKAKANPSASSAPVTLCVLNPVDIYDPIGEIVYYGGHSWPGGVRSPSPKSDIPTSLFNTSQYIWSFLDQFEK